MDERESIQQAFLQGEALALKGLAEMTQAFNRLVTFTTPKATRLNVTFGAPTEKP